MQLECNSPRTSDYRRNCNEMWILSTGLLGISKVMKISLPNLNDIDFRSSESTEKIWWEWHYSFLLSRPHEHGHFWPFFTIQIQGIEQTTNLLFILKVLRCSNNLMQKNDFYNPFYLLNSPSESNFQKF